MKRLFRWIAFLIYMTGEIFKGTYRDFVSTFKEKERLHAAIVELPLRCRSDVEIALFSWAITIPPGTAVIAIAAGTDKAPPSVFIHTMHIPDEESIITELRDLEARLLRCTRKEFVE